MSAIWVEIIATRGSAPRDAGTVMKVTATQTEGTIGGGALEHAATLRARRMLAQGQTQYQETVPLGPTLGQCCGGSVGLRYAATPQRLEAAHVTPLAPRHTVGGPKSLWLWGAGHVGRAVAQTAHPQAFDITWVDTSMDRFPGSIPAHATPVVASDMPLLAKRAAQQADHLIFTYAHDIDLALCAALLKRGVRSCGVIGSKTKWTRFQKRLRAMGLDPAPITCPIGDKSLGKAPDQIALGVIEGLLADQKMTA